MPTSTVILTPLEDTDNVENREEMSDKVKCELDQMGDGSEHTHVTFPI